MRRLMVLGLVLGLGAPAAWAHLTTERISYQDGDATLEGYLARDAHLEHPVPGILVVHEWKGLGPYAERRADQLAQLGYVAFAVDMYGKGVRAASHEEAAKLSGAYRADRPRMRRRIRAGLEVLRQQSMVDGSRLAAIGYCFGGNTVLELARSGADVLGVVSFHGLIDSPTPEDAKQIVGRVLVLQGADDPYVSAEQVAAFRQEMEQAGVDYQLVQYPGAVHSFTVKEAGDDPSQGVAYNAEADRDSWELMKAFLHQIFQESDGLRAATDLGTATDFN